MTADGRAHERALRSRRWALLIVIGVAAAQMVAGVGQPTSASAQSRSLGPAQGPTPAALLPAAAVSSSSGGVITFGAAGLFDGVADVPLSRPIVGMTPTPGAVHLSRRSIESLGTMGTPQCAACHSPPVYISHTCH